MNSCLCLMFVSVVVRNGLKVVMLKVNRLISRLVWVMLIWRFVVSVGSRLMMMNLVVRMVKLVVVSRRIGNSMVRFFCECSCGCVWE